MPQVNGKEDDVEPGVRIQKKRWVGLKQGKAVSVMPNQEEMVKENK